MNCEDCSKILDDGLHAKLTQAERCAVDMHLAACDACAAGWRAHRALARQLVPPAPAGLADRLLTGLPARAPTAAARRKRAAWMAAAACVLALGGALAALSYVAQRAQTAAEEPVADAAPAAANAARHQLGETVVRVDSRDELLHQVDIVRQQQAPEDAVRFPDGEHFALLRVAPEYPALALRERREGTVRVKFTVTKHGTVADVVVLESSDPVFEASAVLAVERWKYMPRVVNGERVDVPAIHTNIRFAMAPPNVPERSRSAPDDPEYQPEPELVPSGRPPLDELLAAAWDCAVVRNLLCAQQVLDSVTASYALTSAEQREILAFYGYLETQHGDFERAIAIYAQAAADDPASIIWVTVMHLYFTRQQYQGALDTGARYLAALKAQHGRSDTGVEQFIAKFEQLGMKPTAAEEQNL